MAHSPKGSLYTVAADSGAVYGPNLHTLNRRKDHIMNISHLQLLREQVSFAHYAVAGSVALCCFALLVGLQLGWLLL